MQSPEMGNSPAYSEIRKKARMVRMRGEMMHCEVRGIDSSWNKEATDTLKLMGRLWKVISKGVT